MIILHWIKMWKWTLILKCKIIVFFREGGRNWVEFVVLISSNPKTKTTKIFSLWTWTSLPVEFYQFLKTEILIMYYVKRIQKNKLIQFCKNLFWFKLFQGQWLMFLFDIVFFSRFLDIKLNIILDIMLYTTVRYWQKNEKHVYMKI